MAKANWDDPQTLAKLRELVEAGSDDVEIAFYFGYTDKRQMKKSLWAHDASLATQILYGRRIAAHLELLQGMWAKARNPDDKQQFAAMKALLERFGELVAKLEDGAPKAAEERSVPLTSEQILAALRPASSREVQ